jgi:acylglycerol lipase
MVPPKLVVHMLIAMANVLPKHKLVPTKDIGDAAFREQKKREQVCRSHLNSKISSVFPPILVMQFICS